MPPDIQAEMLLNPTMLRDMVCPRVTESVCACARQVAACVQMGPAPAPAPTSVPASILAASDVPVCDNHGTRMNAPLARPIKGTFPTTGGTGREIKCRSAEVDSYHSSCQHMPALLLFVSGHGLLWCLLLSRTSITSAHNFFIFANSIVNPPAPAPAPSGCPQQSLARYSATTSHPIFPVFPDPCNPILTDGLADLFDSLDTGPISATGQDWGVASTTLHQPVTV